MKKIQFSSRFELNKILIFIITVLFLSNARVFGATDQVKIYRPRGEAGKSRIQGLKWIVPKETTEIRSTDQNNYQLFVILHGTLDKSKNWKLLWNKRHILLPASQPIDGEEKRKFRMAIPIKGKSTRILIEAQGPAGEVEEEKLDIVFPNWARYSQSLSRPKKIVLKKKRNFITPFLGLSRITYSETSYSSFTQTEVTARIIYKHLLNSRWNFTAEGFSTVAPISTTLSETTASFRGINIATTYSIPVDHGRWNVDLSAGINYNSMSSSKDTFGYSPLIYPQFSPGLRRSFGQGRVLSTYLRYGPLGEGFSPKSFSEKELGAGVSWQHSLRNGKALLMKAEHSNVSFQPDAATDIDIQSTTISLGLTF
jgi:hypothetical protein